MVSKLHMVSSNILIILCIFCLMIWQGMCTEFAVGESKGWGVPPSKDPQLYNEWAQKNRFKVNDTLQFKYKKDSVMVVGSEGEYEKCQTTQPVFFSNKGDTTFLLDRPGLFYFISGVTGHCQRGQKMVIKVLDVETPPPPPNHDDDDDDDDQSNKKNGATRLLFMGGLTSLPSLLLFFILGFLIIV